MFKEQKTENISKFLFDNPLYWNIMRKFISGGFLTDIIGKTLDSKTDEKVLDFGCGVGDYCSLVKGVYVGIDYNPYFIEYAKNKYNDGNKQFYNMDILKVNFDEHEFDKTLYISMLHHFNYENNMLILKELAKVTKNYIIIVDIWPSKNPVRWLLQKMDRGDHISHVEQQKTIINKYFTMVSCERILTRTHSNSHSLFIAKPKSQLSSSNLN